MWRSLILAVSFLVLPIASQANDLEELWQALKDGGKVIMLRHAVVDPDMGESFVLDDSCFTEKNLSDFGKQQALAIHTEFQKRGIAIDQIWSSPYCRTKDTAELAFKRYEVSSLLHLIRTVPEKIAEENQNQIRKILSNYQNPANMVMVTHRPNIADIANIRLQPAQMIVFEPLGDGLFDVLGVLDIPVESDP